MTVDKVRTQNLSFSCIQTRGTHSVKIFSIDLDKVGPIAGAGSIKDLHSQHLQLLATF